MQNPHIRTATFKREELMVEPDIVISGENVWNPTSNIRPEVDMNELKIPIQKVMERKALSNEAGSLMDDDYPKSVLDFRRRLELKKFFHHWLMFYFYKKKIRHKYLKTRYIMTRLKLNRVLTAWKNTSRKCQVTKVKMAMVCHTSSQRSKKEVLDAWRYYIKLKRKSCAVID